MKDKIKFYYSLSTFINYGVMSIVTTFYVPYLNQVVGLSLSEVGKVVSIGALFAIISQQILVGKFSAIHNKKKFVMIHLSALVCMILFLMFINKSIIYLYAILYGIIVQTSSTIYEVYVEGMCSKQKMEYSQIRKWGSIGFGCIVLLSGTMILKYGFKSIHILGAVMTALIVFIIASKFKNIDSKEQRSTLKLKDILKNKNSIILAISNVLIIGTYTAIEFAYSTYLIQITENADLANSIYSKSIFSRVVLEFLSFMFVGKFLNHKDPKKYLIMAFFIAATRILLFSTSNVILVVLGDQLHGVMYACYLTFLFKYIRNVVDDNLVAGTYSLVNVLGSAGANFIYPQMFSAIQVKFGYSIMYLVGFFIIFMFTLISIKMLPKEKVYDNNTKVVV
ncbi:MFS transporter [Clostridium saccharobutylicum]|uniref:Major facilitator superfamily MFS_1 n=1 Tax=Clostridium saccharobutylicum DSM 13864 TaxID=1345695 RepID=U5MM64_CLOSA|nr:MFS transporter [Clostridium saccharobutylicum]AGX41690.1 major facilitator superfamily MFS_1 [Clostridium saccharobutylicum DSM 13864]AQR88973.1 galactoside permease [Clostridium saccharobutylicum]AQR98874.1 galactoside permease [Clostridium saccharobutylicum]AQS12862.1 galactoside permease [Clostridium saccharobutylicum]MBA2904024.1 OHS family lactose permease-like MFS transporter [Clostridium saccharobutylicum]